MFKQGTLGQSLLLINVYALPGFPMSLMVVGECKKIRIEKEGDCHGSGSVNLRFLEENKQWNRFKAGEIRELNKLLKKRGEIFLPVM